MNPHRTTNPAIRAKHIADREEHKRYQELLSQNVFPDWPKLWLDIYHNILPELVENDTNRLCPNRTR